MTNIQMIGDFTKGINTEPVSSRDRFSPHRMVNLEINQETGYLELRRGFVRDDAEIKSESGNNLYILNYRDSFEQRSQRQIYAIHAEESLVHIGRRIFITGADTANRWVDLERDVTYRWEIVQPPHPPVPVYPTATGATNYDLTLANTINERINSFSACITFASSKFDIETPPSQASVFLVKIDADRPGQGRVPLKLNINLTGAPEWADTMYIYVQRVPIGGITYRRREDFTNDPIVQAGGFDPTNDLIHDAIPGLASSLVATPVINPGQTSDGKAILHNASTLQEAGYEYVRVRGYGFSAPSTETALEQNINLGIEYVEGNTGDFDATTQGDTQSSTPKTAYDANISPNSYTHRLEFITVANPPQNFEHTILYAGRIWGYDRDKNALDFSYIDGNGDSRHDYFPFTDVVIPHSINLEGMQESEVTALHVMPGRGGIYVFFRDNIRTIVGQALIQGLQSRNVPPLTDLDASGGIPDFGTLSPRSIVNFRSSTIFLGSDRRLWQLIGTNIQNIGQPIQKFLDDIPESRMSEVSAFGI